MINAIARYRNIYKNLYRYKLYINIFLARQVTPTLTFTLNMLFICLLPPLFPMKSAIKHNLVCLYIMSYFVLLLSRFPLAAITSSNIFSANCPLLSLSLSLSHCTCVDMLAIVTQISKEKLCSVFFNVFGLSPLQIGWFLLANVQFTDSCSFNWLYFSTVKFL